MKKFFVITTLSAIVMSAAAANAQDSNMSVSVMGGWSSHPGVMLGGTKTDMKDGYDGGARLSTRLDGMGLPGFSADVDTFYNASGYRGASSASLHSTSVMGDLMYHLPVGATPWSLYGGAGLGLVHDNLNGNLHGSSDVLGWQGLGGAEYAFTPVTSMFAEYRYQNAHDANIGTVRNVGNTSNNLSVGVKFGF